MQNLNREVRDSFTAALLGAVKNAYPELDIDAQQIASTITASLSNGDMTTAISFKLAKPLKASPSSIARNIVPKIGKVTYVSKLEELNGYINAFLDEGAYTAAVLSRVAEGSSTYGKSDIGKGEKVMVEFPSVNPNKQWHVGHLRNALLGDTICNLLGACSYKVEREDYIDDLGLQIAETAWGWKNLSDKPDKKFDLWLGEQYVEVNKRITENPELKTEMYGILKKMEDVNSAESLEIRGIAERCVKAQSETSFAYGIYHDVMVWESDIVRALLLRKALDIAMKAGVVEKPTEGKYAGCIVVKLDKLSKFAKELEGSREDSKVIVRSNGAATYLGKDFAFHLWKFGIIESGFKYKKFIEQPDGRPLFSTSPDGSAGEFGNEKRAINIIDASQYYNQLILKLMFSLMGRDDCANNLVHLAYGKVNIAGGGLSTRKGTWQGEGRSYTADDLLREVKAKTLDIVSNSEKIASKDSAEDISEKVAVAAIKFEFLRIAPEKEIVFSWEKALSFEGNSGPYCQYTYARASRIIEKAGSFAAPASFSHVSRSQDFELVKLMGRFEDIVEKACGEYRPNVITDYLLDLSSAFSKFYEAMPVLKGGEAMEERLAIVAAFRQVVRNGLALLGIGVVERM
ncbi:Arginine--tRNA ligase [uncultured archaeon]|nr:Arginine--tRNA ligase [uncultured archaeon]